MVLNYPRTFEPWALVKIFRVTQSVRREWNMLLNYLPSFEPWALV